MYYYYIKKDSSDNIIDSFSSWQTEKFDGTEIITGGGIERHYNLVLFDDRVYRLKWQNNKIKVKTTKEKDDERALLPVYKPKIDNLIEVLINKGVILESDL